MSGRSFYAVVIAGVVAVLLIFGTYTVKQTELALVFLLGGEIKLVQTEPGLHFRIPFVHNVKTFDRRIITQNHPQESFLTSEGKILNVDFFVKWRIKDVATYFRATGGDENNANNRIGENVRDEIKGVITTLTIQQIVAAERAAVTGKLLREASRNVNQLGVELVDVRVRRIDLPDEVSDSVYRRMQQSFAAQAAKLRAEGQAAAETIRAGADRERTEILAEASREAQRIRGDGDSQATDIYARTYNRNPEFYEFYRSLQGYRNSLGRDNDVLVISPDSEFFKYLKRPDGR
jgi:membrane protease subunit HflC